MIPVVLSKLFVHPLRVRGDAYWAEGRVKILHASNEHVVALAQGSERYGLRIVASPRRISLQCDCPFAVDQGACKHLWALLRALDVDSRLSRLLATAGASVKVELHANDGDDLDDFDGFDDLEADDDHPDDAPGSAGRSTAWTRRAEDKAPGRKAHGAAPREPEWRRALQRAAQSMRFAPPPTAPEPEWPAHRRLVYLIDIDASATAPGIAIDLGLETLRKNGSWGEPKAFTLGVPAWFASPDPVDGAIMHLLAGASTVFNVYQRTSGFVVPPRSFDPTLRAILESGKARLRARDAAWHQLVLRLDDGAPWRFAVRIQGSGASSRSIEGVLMCGQESMPVRTPQLINPAGFLITNGLISRFDGRTFSPLARELITTGALEVDAPVPDVVAALTALPQSPAMELPDDGSVTMSSEPPIAIVTLSGRAASWYGTALFDVVPSFSYGSLRVAPDTGGATCFDAAHSVLHTRDREFERRAMAHLGSLGARREWNPYTRTQTLVVPDAKVWPLVAALSARAWRVELDGARVRMPGVPRASVSSGVDWFEVTGSVPYDDLDASLDAILAAQAAGRPTVTLTDGSTGVLPLEWLQRVKPLLASGETTPGGRRFGRHQLLLLDALLASMPEVSVDQTFAIAREALGSFQAVLPEDPSPKFCGTLRGYQREGLGWLQFLQRFGLGGCLADDMGLGKTVQVLALLAGRRGTCAAPSLLVVPRSLVFNWMREAARFAPELRVVDHSGAGRHLDNMENADLVITTYGTARRDIATLATREFDYVVLDEAQAIKTASTASAKACRLLRARHRLALTGTPVENRVEELWSLLEFLNPGMLGPSAHFADLVRLGGAESFARALRPIILRRTKDAVASDLPKRTEQTLLVDLEPKQRRVYETLLRAQRDRVLGTVDRVGLGKARMHILEALLRLRQVACHPALVDEKHRPLPSAKLDALIPSLAELAAEGHKTLVFSQFTQFLSLVRERLDSEGMTYEYLDGRTRDRERRVSRFQQDADCRLFLISLKAGGHGLNLTAADYVYLLDPWWNPAVEAQAIDRAHRIGQARPVIATRIIARDTVEEKILQLQAGKRALADAILSEDAGVLSSIGREELELLLG